MCATNMLQHKCHGSTQAWTRAVYVTFSRVINSRGFQKVQPTNLNPRTWNKEDVLINNSFDFLLIKHVTGCPMLTSSGMGLLQRVSHLHSVANCHKAKKVCPQRSTYIKQHSAAKVTRHLDLTTCVWINQRNKWAKKITALPNHLNTLVHSEFPFQPNVTKIVSECFFFFVIHGVINSLL